VGRLIGFICILKVKFLLSRRIYDIFVEKFLRYIHLGVKIIGITIFEMAGWTMKLKGGKVTAVLLQLFLSEPAGLTQK
jgi:hypothetical protein